MRLRVRDIRDVAERQLCCGCGVCAYISPDQIEMVDTLDYGRRPRMRVPGPAKAPPQEAMRVCPGIELRHTFDRSAPGLIREFLPGWGPLLEVWEGHAAEAGLRYAGSSGGAASALALYCIEKGGMNGVLHIAARPDVPYLNHAVLSTSRAAILAATGSRYAPASPCDGLQMVAAAPAPCVFIGKPCDVAGAQKARGLRPELDRNMGLTIAIFCAGTPTTRGTLALLRKMGVSDPASVTSLRYRGNGWPGRATVTFRTSGGVCTRSLSYEESWGQVLSHHRQWRCNLCPDHTGEFADISVGDPWHREASPSEPGRSLVLVRTVRGQRCLSAAMETGYLTLERADPEVLAASQPNLLRGRAAVWGRLRALRLLGIPTPRYSGLPMFRFFWSELSLSDKARSFCGTIKRAFTRKLCRRHVVTPYFPTAEPPRQCAPPGRGLLAAATSRST